MLPMLPPVLPPVGVPGGTAAVCSEFVELPRVDVFTEEPRVDGSESVLVSQRTHFVLTLLCPRETSNHLCKDFEPFFRTAS